MIKRGSFVVINDQPMTPYKVDDVIDTMSGTYVVLLDQEGFPVDMVNINKLNEVEVRVHRIEQWCVI